MAKKKKVKLKALMGKNSSEWIKKSGARVNNYKLMSKKQTRVAKFLFSLIRRFTTEILLQLIERIIETILIMLIDKL